MTIPAIIVDALIQAGIAAVQWVIRLFRRRRQKRENRDRLRKIAGAPWKPTRVRLSPAQREALKRRMTDD